MGEKQQVKKKDKKTKVSKKQILLTFLVVFLVILGYLGIAFRFWVVAGDTIKRHVGNYYIDKYMEACNFSGTILAARNGEIIFVKGYGVTDNSKGEESKKCNADTVYPIFSLTKQFTAYAVYQLESEGKLNRSDLLSKYFDNCVYGDDTTIEDLLSMRSGIPEFLNDLDDAEKYEGIDSEILLSKILNYELEGKGEYKYSNSNYFLLGCIIEKVSGLSFEDYIQEYVVEPAGMEEVTFDPQAAQSKGFSPEDTSRETIEYHSSITYGAGDICTTIVNLARWQNYLYSSPASKEFLNFGMDAEKEVYSNGIVKSGYYYGHTGGGKYHRHCMWYNTATGMQVIVLSNNERMDANAVSLVVEQLLSRYY